MLDIQKVLQKIDYEAQDSSWLYTALTHKSYFKNTAGVNWGDNEKLEFLGDAVLDLVMADILMQTFPNDDEGHLSRKRASLVNEEGLSEMAKSLRLHEDLLMGEAENDQGLRENKRILAGTFEALVGGMYKDRGYSYTKEWIHRTFQKALDHSFSEHDYKRDFKTRFQELAQSLWKRTPTYRLKEVHGPDHNKEFCVEVLVDEKIYGEGWGESKKAASQKAAEQAFYAFEDQQKQENK